MPEPSAEFCQQALTHLDTLYNFALRLTKRPPDADDLVQETYLRAFRFAHRFEPGTHLRAWLFQILRNTFLTFYRRETHQPVLLVAEALTVLDLERALAELPEDFRSVLLLADLEGLALHEIGQIMDVPIGTVKSRLFRARRMVRRRLGDYRTH